MNLLINSKDIFTNKSNYDSKESLATTSNSFDILFYILSAFLSQQALNVIIYEH